jgi:hypothetical protein
VDCLRNRPLPSCECPVEVQSGYASSLLWNDYHLGARLYQRLDCHLDCQRKNENLDEVEGRFLYLLPCKDYWEQSDEMRGIRRKVMEETVLDSFSENKLEDKD